MQSIEENLSMTSWLCLCQGPRVRSKSNQDQIEKEAKDLEEERTKKEHFHYAIPGTMKDDLQRSFCLSLAGRPSLLSFHLPSGDFSLACGSFLLSLCSFACSSPLVALVLAKPEAISHWRSLMGRTSVDKAKAKAPHSLRALYGTGRKEKCRRILLVPFSPFCCSFLLTEQIIIFASCSLLFVFLLFWLFPFFVFFPLFLDNTRNGLHGSDSPQSAEREIRFFFPHLALGLNTETSRHQSNLRLCRESIRLC